MKPYKFAPALLILLSACGGSGGGGPSAAPGYAPELLTPGVVQSMAASNGDAESPAISGDGQFVTFLDFSSSATLDDTNERGDVALHDVRAGTNVHVSRGRLALPSDGGASLSASDADGSHIVFGSRASDLVPGDTNDNRDVFLYVAQTGEITRVNVDSAGNQATDGYSGDPAISADGTIIVFRSTASNLVPGDTNGHTDVFVHDTTTGVTSRVSVATGGAQATTAGSWQPDISADGNLVVFESDASDLITGDGNDARDVFLHDRMQGTTIRISRDTNGGDANGSSRHPRISADGSTIVFASEATDLIPSDTNDREDVFAYDVLSGAITRVSVGPAFAQGNDESWEPDVSADGQYVTFTSDASNLVASDTNDVRDVFRHDRSNGTTVRVSVDAAGAEAGGGAEDPAISNDGMRVAFKQGEGYFSPDGKRVDTSSNVFLKDLGTDALTLLSTAVDRSLLDGPTSANALSANGRWLAFAASATNLVPGDTNNRGDLFLRDMTTGDIARVLTVDPDGVRMTYWDLSVSNDGRLVCFSCDDPGLLGPGVDTNGRSDVYVLDTGTGVLERISEHTDGTEGNGSSIRPVMTPDGALVLFRSNATTLISGDADDNFELWLRDVAAGTTARAVFDKDGLPIEHDIDAGDISDNGRYISLETDADDLLTTPDTNGGVDVFRYDRTARTHMRASVDWTGAEVAGGQPNAHQMSGDGMVLMWLSRAPDYVEHDTNNEPDVFVRDLDLGTTTRANVDSMGNESVDGYPTPIQLSTNGDIVIFTSGARDLAPGLENYHTRIFARERSSGTTMLASRAHNGGRPRASSYASRQCLGPDGATLVYRTPFRSVFSLFRIELHQITD